MNENKPRADLNLCGFKPVPNRLRHSLKPKNEAEKFQYTKVTTSHWVHAIEDGNAQHQLQQRFQPQQISENAMLTVLCQSFVSFSLLSPAARTCRGSWHPASSSWTNGPQAASSIPVTNCSPRLLKATSYAEPHGKFSHLPPQLLGAHNSKEAPKFVTDPRQKASTKLMINID